MSKVSVGFLYEMLSEESPSDADMGTVSIRSHEQNSIMLRIYA